MVVRHTTAAVLARLARGPNRLALDWAASTARIDRT
jgi:hypothetical protein